jgi:hypothetical protein
MTKHVTLHYDDFKRHFIIPPLTGVSYDVISRHFAVALEIVKTPDKERDDLVQTYEWLVVNPKKLRHLLVMLPSATHKKKTTCYHILVHRYLSDQTLV